MTVYYLDMDSGDDAKDGLSEANAWKTLNQADSVVGGGNKVHCTGTQAFTAYLTLVGKGDTTNGWVEYEGYGSTPGDGEIGAAFDFTPSFRRIIVPTGSVYIRWKNCRWFGGTDTTGTMHASSSANIQFINCKFDTCTHGLALGGGCLVLNCQFISNSVTGIKFQTQTGYKGICVNCFFESNEIGATMNGFFVGCVFKDNEIAIKKHINDCNTVVSGCTFDANTFDLEDSDHVGVIAVINSVFHDTVTDVVSGTYASEHIFFATSAFHPAAIEPSVAMKFMHCITTDTDLGFKDAANNDYTPTAGSPLIGAGSDQDFPSLLDIGAFQSKLAV